MNTNKMTTQSCPIRAYGRTELAGAYSPHTGLQTAWRRLRDWIACNKELSEALEKAGYKASQRTFTPKQVALIFEYLGEP